MVQGFCIRVNAHNGVSDGKTTSMFLNSWAHICSQANHFLPEDLSPSYDRTVINIPPEIETYLYYYLKSQFADLSCFP